MARIYCVPDLADVRPWYNGAIAYISYYLAIAAMPLAQAVAIIFTAPIIVTVLSALFLSESVGLRRWTAVISAFVAVLIVLGPGGSYLQLASLLALFAALTYAGTVLLTTVSVHAIRVGPFRFIRRWHFCW